MAKIYRVTLISEDGDEYDTLFELAGSPGMLGNAAPAALAAALAEVGIAPAAATGNGTAGLLPATSQSYFADAAGNGPGGSPVLGGNYSPGQPKSRTRRTKAEMAAARARDEAAAATLPAAMQPDADRQEVSALAKMNSTPAESTTVVMDNTAATFTPDESAAAPYNPFAVG